MNNLLFWDCSGFLGFCACFKDRAGEKSDKSKFPEHRQNLSFSDADWNIIFLPSFLFFSRWKTNRKFAKLFLMKKVFVRIYKGVASKLISKFEEDVGQVMTRSLMKWSPTWYLIRLTHQRAPPLVFVIKTESSIRNFLRCYISRRCGCER